MVDAAVIIIPHILSELFLPLLSVPEFVKYLLFCPVMAIKCHVIVHLCLPPGSVTSYIKFLV